MLLELAGREVEPLASPASSAAARRVLREVLAAIRRAAPTIARPILDEAVDEERLTPAQKRRILERLRTSPPRSRMAAAVPGGG